MNRRHFETGGNAYAQYRPTYPPELAGVLAELAPNRALAVDVGCGTGQLSVLLAQQFDRVEACDISADQVANAEAHPRVHYSVAPAEALPVEDGRAAVVTAAQAAHWFDLPAFYEEVRRILTPGGSVALITYGVPVIDGPLAERFEQFYAEDLADHWPPERRLVERGYADLPFPFEEVAPPALRIERQWRRDELLGYVGTWSATRRALAAGHGELVQTFLADAQRFWPQADTRHRVTWPLAMRIGRA